MNPRPARWAYVLSDKHGTQTAACGCRHAEPGGAAAVAFSEWIAARGDGPIGRNVSRPTPLVCAPRPRPVQAKFEHNLLIIHTVSRKKQTSWGSQTLAHVSHHYRRTIAVRSFLTKAPSSLPHVASTQRSTRVAAIIIVNSVAYCSTGSRRKWDRGSGSPIRRTIQTRSSMGR
jgi:hypothetical protein